jgi:hypothetical protein
MLLVNVTKNKVTIANDYVVNRGEYKVNKIQFAFTEDYSGLVKKAIFKDSNNVIEQAIINDECDIPYEVLNSTKIELRVYGYEVANEELVLRYSPQFTYILTTEGSYIAPTGQGEEITPTQFEQYEQALNDGLEEVANVDIDAVKEGHIATVTITNRLGESKDVQILDGEKGDKGEKRR